MVQRLALAITKARWRRQEICRQQENCGQPRYVASSVLQGFTGGLIVHSPRGLSRFPTLIKQSLHTPSFPFVNVLGQARQPGWTKSATALAIRLQSAHPTCEKALFDVMSIRAFVLFFSQDAAGKYAESPLSQAAATAPPHKLPRTRTPSAD